MALYFSSQDLSQIVPPSADELRKLEEALLGGIVTDPPQLSELRSLAFRFASSKDFSEQRKKILEQIAYRLPEVSQLYSTAKAAKDNAQQALDRLNILQAEKKMHLTTYSEKEAERKVALAEEEAIRRRIEEIETSLAELRQELQTLCPLQEEAVCKLNVGVQEQRNLYLLSTPLDQRIKQLDSQKGVFIYDLERGQSDV